MFADGACSPQASFFLAPYCSAEIPAPAYPNLPFPIFASNDVMEIKNLFDPAVKQDIINRINTLSPASTPIWGKMNVAQMLAHLQFPIGIAFGTQQPKGSFLLRLIGPLFKSKLWDGSPWKQGLPTDPTFITTGTDKDFEKEKAALLGLLNRFSESAIVGEKHPIFGKMTKENWSRATWKHIDHHLRQFGA